MDHDAARAELERREDGYGACLLSPTEQDCVGARDAEGGSAAGDLREHGNTGPAGQDADA